MSHTPAPADLDARKRALLGEFHRFLPDASVLHTEEALKPYECDGLTAYRQVPLVAVLPETVEQVQEAMRTCSRRSPTWRAPARRWARSSPGASSPPGWR